MTAQLGRNLKIFVDSVLIAGVRTKTISTNAAVIDITDINSAGYRELLADSGEWSLDVSVDGVTKDDALRDAINTGTDIELTNAYIEYPNGTQITGTFILTNLEENGTYSEGMLFSATISKSGQ